MKKLVEQTVILAACEDGFVQEWIHGVDKVKEHKELFYKHAKDFLDIPTQVFPANAFNPMAPPDLLTAAQMGIQYQASGNIDVSQLIFSGDYFLGLKASKVYVQLSTLNIKHTKVVWVTQV